MTTIRQRILAAYLNRNELLAQAQGLAAVPDPAEKARFWAAYRTARSELARLQPAPSTPPLLTDLPTEARPYLERLEGTSAFQDGFGGFEYRFMSVPIDRICPLQMFSNLEPALSPPPVSDLDATLNYALPNDASIPGETVITPAGFRFTSPRYGHGPQNLRRRLSGHQVVVSFEHVNLVQVRRFGNTLVMFNGTHRAVEMWRAGITSIPAIVIEHQNPGEAEWPTGPGFFATGFLLANPRQPPQGARPPLIPDLLSNLSVECQITTTPTVVEVGFGGQQGAQPQAPQGIMIPLGGLQAIPGR